MTPQEEADDTSRELDVLEDASRRINDNERLSAADKYQQLSAIEQRSNSAVNRLREIEAQHGIKPKYEWRNWNSRPPRKD